MRGDGVLVLVAGPLAVLRKALEGLVDEGHVALVYIETKQPETARRTAADTVQELKRLANQVVVGFVVLIPQVVLKQENNIF